MAVSREEINRRKDLIKQMIYICEKDVKPFDWEASGLWMDFAKKYKDENDIALLAADDAMFIAALRMFTCAIEITCYDEDVEEVAPNEGE